MFSRTGLISGGLAAILLAAAPIYSFAQDKEETEEETTETEYKPTFDLGIRVDDYFLGTPPMYVNTPIELPAELPISVMSSKYKSGSTHDSLEEMVDEDEPEEKKQKKQREKKEKKQREPKPKKEKVKKHKPIDTEPYNVKLRLDRRVYESGSSITARGFLFDKESNTDELSIVFYRGDKNPNNDDIITTEDIEFNYNLSDKLTWKKKKARYKESIDIPAEEELEPGDYKAVLIARSGYIDVVYSNVVNFTILSRIVAEEEKDEEPAEIVIGDAETPAVDAGEPTPTETATTPTESPTIDTGEPTVTTDAAIEPTEPTPTETPSVDTGEPTETPEVVEPVKPKIPGLAEEEIIIYETGPEFSGEFSILGINMGEGVYYIDTKETEFLPSFTVHDSDSNIVNITAEIKYTNDNYILKDFTVWNYEGTGIGVDCISTSLNECDSGIMYGKLNREYLPHMMKGIPIVPPAPFTPALFKKEVAYDLRYVAADNDNQYAVTEWISFAIMDPDSEESPEELKVEEPGFHSPIKTRVDSILFDRQVELEEKYSNLKHKRTLEENLATVDEFFNSGIIAYAVRNELDLDFTGLDIDANARSITHIDEFAGKYFFTGGDYVERDDAFHEMGSDPMRDYFVMEDVAEILRETLEDFENLKWDNATMTYLVGNPETEAYKEFSVQMFETSVSCQLYRPDTSMGQMFIQEARDKGFEFDLEENVLYISEDEGMFYYSVFSPSE